MISLKLIRKRLGRSEGTVQYNRLYRSEYSRILENPTSTGEEEDSDCCKVGKSVEVG